MRTILIVVLLLFAGAAGWLVGSQQNTSTQGVETEDAEPQAPALVRAIGKLQPESGLIQVYAPQGQQIESLFDLKVGDYVKIDQPVIRLAGMTLREMELEIAQAKKKDAENQLEFERSKARLNRATAKLALDEARAQRESLAVKAKNIELLKNQHTVAVKYLLQLERLAADKATENMVGDLELNKQRLLVQQLETQMAQGKDEIRLAAGQADRAEAAAELDVQTVELMIAESASAVPLNTLNKAIEAADRALQRAVIKSPIDGQILDIIVRPGDTATNQAVMWIGNTSKMVCVAEVNDNQMQHVAIGASVTISSLAFPQPLAGSVVAKGIMIGPPSLKDPNPFARVDRKTVQVVISLDDDEAVDDFVNLQVDIEIKVTTAAPKAPDASSEP